MENVFLKNIERDYGISPLPEDATSTMAYVPFQINQAMYSPDVGLENGTMFKSLNKPFCGGKGGCEND